MTPSTAHVCLAGRVTKAAPRGMTRTASKATTSATSPPVELPWPRPFAERVRDYSAIAAYLGGTYGAATAAKHGAPLLGGAVWIGGHWVLVTGSFLGIRELLIQDRWERDREGVSGLAAAIIGGGVAAAHLGRRAAAPVSAGCFVGGCALHYAHRWFLRFRMEHEGMA